MKQVMSQQKPEVAEPHTMCKCAQSHAIQHFLQLQVHP